MLVIAASALLGAAPLAFAHTTIKAQATEGVSDDNALKIGHGCETADGDHIPVIAQSVLFPTLAPEVTSSDGLPISDLSQVIEQGSLVGLARPLQDRSIFHVQRQKYDSLNNVIGFSAAMGSLNPEIPGRVPFQFAAPKFVSSSCAKRLLIRVAIADFCIMGNGLSDALQFGKLNAWIPDNGSTWSTMAKAQNVDGVGAPATLTVNRNLTTNPLSPSCGAGVDVTVTPSATDIDTNMGLLSGLAR